MFFNLILLTLGALSVGLGHLLSRYAAAHWEFCKNDPYSNVDGSWLCFLQLLPRFPLFFGYFCWAVALIVDLYYLSTYLLTEP